MEPDQKPSTSDGFPLCLLFIHPPAHGSEVSPAARNTLDSARIPGVSKLLICDLFQKGRVLAQDGVEPICRMLPIACAPKKVDPALIAKARESAAVPSQRSVTLGLR